MKNIISFNVPTNDLTFEHVIDFYFICQQSGHGIYLCRDGEMCQIRRVTEWVAFILMSRDDRLLIIIEGEKAKTTMKQLLTHLYTKRGSKNVV